MELLKYGCVGLLSNLIAYLGYLTLVWLNMDPKVAMTVVYVVAVLQSFLLNRSWTFQFGGDGSKALSRYFAAYFLGYVMNLVVLYCLVDRAGYSHEIVQGAIILPMALFLFLMQKLWVFRERSHG